MTERGLPIVGGAPACPFVAFEDDRDERATNPDHRHRCYAETQPASRALAHQEAYCLSSAFPVCPTFQDWAHREAARARADAAGSAESRPAVAPEAPGRNPPRSWAAPPPWLSRTGEAEGGAQDAEWADDDPDVDPGAPFEAPADPIVPRRGRGLSGSYADRVASDPAVAVPGGMGDGPEDWDDEDELGGMSEAAPEAVVRSRRRERDPGRLAAVTAGDAGPARHDRRPERRHDGPSPEWERPKPLEAYPTLRSRRLPELSVPPILVAVIAIALAMAVVFALPGLLGFGTAKPGASPTASTPIRTPLPSLAPTPVPRPTATIYLVAPGDTMSRIAGRFGVSLEDLIAANLETVPDPNKLQIGQEVIIPVPLATELPAASEIPGAT